MQLTICVHGSKHTICGVKEYIFLFDWFYAWQRHAIYGITITYNGSLDKETKMIKTLDVNIKCTT